MPNSPSPLSDPQHSALLRIAANAVAAVLVCGAVLLVAWLLTVFCLIAGRWAENVAGWIA